MPMLAKKVVELPLKPRPWQLPAINDPSPRIILVVHRRAGKSTALMWRAIKRMLLMRRRQPAPRAVYLLPYNVQWSRTGMWDQIAAAARSIPDAVTIKSERLVRLPNGATIQCGGADNPDVWRGGGADEAICDEFDDMDPSVVPLVIEPMLADRDGVLVISGTPKGRGHLRSRWLAADGAPDWSRTLLRWQDTGVIPEAAIERLRREMSPGEFAQEMECSFDAPHAGAVFGQAMARAEEQGRITRISWEPTLPVHTAWDLGRRHAMVVWLFQVVSREVRIIDVIWGVGGDLPMFAKALDRRPYKYGTHYLPHDARVGEIGTGKTRVETLLSLGIRASLVPNISKADGLTAANSLIERTWFNVEPLSFDGDNGQERMGRAIRALFEYRREWVPQLESFRMDTVNDWTADYADAYRMLAVGLDERPKSAGTLLANTDFSV